MSIDTFNKRWNIEDEFSNEEEFNILKTRINNIFKQYDIDKLIGFDGVQIFCNELGIDIENYCSNINIYFENISNLVGLAKGLELLTTIKSNHNIEKMIEGIYNFAILKSKIISGTVNKNNMLITYPAGEKLLDEEVINNVISFLSGDPLNHFITGLKSIGTWQSLEALRKCLEEYLRLKFSNDKNYTNNLDELGRTLGKGGLNKEVIIVIMNQLKSIESYFNETSKHKTKAISISENEYVLYGVANVLKLINETL